MDSDTIQIEWLEEREANESDSGAGAPKAGQEERQEQAGFMLVRRGGRTYLTCDGGNFCEDEEAMLAANHLEGCLAVRKQCVDGQIRLSYDITGKQSLSACYGKRAVAFQELRMLLLAVRSCLYQTEEYLLSEDHLVFCPDYVYTNVTGRQFYFVYLPSFTGTFAEHIKELACFLMEHVDYQDERAVALAGQLYRYADAENFSMTVFLEENRVYFEETDRKGRQNEQTDDSSVQGEPAQWKQREEGEDLERADRLREGRKQWSRIGFAAAAISGFAAWSSPQYAQILIPAGICTGITAGILSCYIGWAKRMLTKKEREIYRFSEGAAGDGAAAGVSAGVVVASSASSGSAGDTSASSASSGSAGA